MRSFSVFLTLATTALIFLPACTKSDDKGEAREAKTGPVRDTHDDGERGGKKFHVKVGGKTTHEYLCECVFKDGKLKIYIIDHDDAKKTFKAEETEISITGLKHGGKNLPEIKLTAQEMDGENWFEATGSAIPTGIEDQHDLAGGKFSVTVGKTKIDGFFKEKDDEAHEKEKHEKEKTGEHKEKK